jgi:hypothetical protein
MLTTGTEMFEGKLASLFLDRTTWYKPQQRSEWLPSAQLHTSHVLKLDCPNIVKKGKQPPVFCFIDYQCNGMAPSYNSSTPYKRKSDKEHFPVSVSHSLLNKREWTSTADFTYGSEGLYRGCELTDSCAVLSSPILQDEFQ